MAVLRFSVAGTPQPAGSKRHVGGGRIVDACKGAAAWKDRMAAAAAQAAQEQEWALTRQPVMVGMVFARVRPRAHYRTGRNAGLLKADAPAHCATKPDALKLARGVEDSMTGIIYADDSQIVIESISKVWADDGAPAGVSVTVRTL